MSFVTRPTSIPSARCDMTNVDSLLRRKGIYQLAPCVFFLSHATARAVVIFPSIVDYYMIADESAYSFCFLGISCFLSTEIMSRNPTNSSFSFDHFSDFNHVVRNISLTYIFSVFQSSYIPLCYNRVGSNPQSIFFSIFFKFLQILGYSLIII